MVAAVLVDHRSCQVSPHGTGNSCDRARAVVGTAAAGELASQKGSEAFSGSKLQL